MKILTPTEVTHISSLPPDDFVQLAFDIKEIIENHAQMNTIIGDLLQHTSVDVAKICTRKRPGS